MNPSRTTLWGAIAGAATAIQALPDVAGWLKLSAILVAALGIAGLGYHSTDCPPNCPGTDADGNPKPPPLPSPAAAALLLAAVLAASVLVFTAGCTIVRAGSHVQTNDGTNSVNKGASLWGVTFFDSGQVLGKTHLSYEAATNGTWAPGVNMSGLTQQASSTGLVTIIQNFPKLAPVP